MSVVAMSGVPDVPVFTKETIVRGRRAQIECLEIDGQTFSIDRGLVTVVGLEDDWYEDVRDPAAAVRILKEVKSVRPDIFTFWQRIPDVEPRFSYHHAWEEIAVLPVTTYDHWWKSQINAKTRNLVRKSEKLGVVVKEVPYDDEFVEGMTNIFNETPVRQGRPFWHYGKTFETIKAQFSRFVFRERMIGAYFGGEMIGFAILANAGRFGITGQIISSIKHRDKSATNALIAKAVAFCEAQKLGYLVYMYWSDGSLAAFKRHCGFKRVRVPRYYVPLTWKGRVALASGLHRGWRSLIPAGLNERLKELRRRWHKRDAE